MEIIDETGRELLIASAGDDSHGNVGDFAILFTELAQDQSDERETWICAKPSHMVGQNREIHEREQL